MNIKRAIWMGVLAYLASFFIGIIGAAVLGIDLTTAVEPSMTLWIWGIVFTIVLMGLFALWYFKTETPSVKTGLYFGLIAVGVGFVIDAIIIVPFILSSTAPQDPLAYYLNPLFWLTLVLLVATTTLVGWWKAKK